MNRYRPARLDLGPDLPWVSPSLRPALRPCLQSSACFRPLPSSRTAMSRLLAGKRVVCPKTSASSVLGGTPTPSRRRRDASRNWPAVLLASPGRAVGSVRTADEPANDERPPSFAPTIQRETTEHYIKRVGSWPADVPRFLCCSLQSSAPAVGGFPPRAIGVNLYRASRTSFSVRPVLRPHDILLEHEPCQGASRERHSRELTSDSRESVRQCSWTERAASRPLRLSGATGGPRGCVPARGATHGAVD